MVANLARVGRNGGRSSGSARELARVLEHLGTPGLYPGIARELRKQVATLEREIAVLNWLTGQSHTTLSGCRACLRNKDRHYTWQRG